MKKFCLMVLTLVLALTCTGAMASITIPEKMPPLDQIPQRPAEVEQWGLTYDGDEIQVHIDDDRPVEYVELHANDFSFQLTPDADGSLIHHLTGEDRFDPDNVTVDIYFNNAAGDHVEYVIIDGMPSVTEYWTLPDDSDLFGRWDGNGNLLSVSICIHGDGNKLWIEYDPAGEIASVSIDANEVYGHFDAAGNLLSGILAMDDMLYTYNAKTDKWQCDTQAAPEDPVEPTHFDMLESVMLRILDGLNTLPAK